VALSDIVSRRMAIQWFEGVAILQEVCGALAGQDGRLTPPDSSSIRITAQGTVIVRPGASGEAAVLRLGRLLSELIAYDPQVPPPLRLCISQATSVPPALATTEEWSASLAYFARPDRPALISAVHDRYLRTPAGELQAERAVVTDSQQVPGKTSEPQRRKHSTRRPAGLYLALAAGVAIICVRTLGGGEGLTNSLDVGALIESLNLDAFNRQPAAPVEPATEAAPRRAPRHASARSNEAADPTSSGIDSGDGRALPVGERTLLQSATVIRPEGSRLHLAPEIRNGSPDGALSAVHAHERVTIRAQQAVYSSDDADVVPPVMVYPQLPPPPRAQAEADTVNALEVVIGADGLVDRVRLVSTPRRLTDMMLLSAAANWRFTPAKLDGASVPYRATIRWAVPQP
jgi:hypothetical protein